MTDPRDTSASFDMIAAEVESLFVLIGEAESDAQLAIVRDAIRSVLDGAGLRWTDIALRVVAPRPTTGSELASPSSEVLTVEDLVTKHAGAAPLQSAPSVPVLPDEELARYGYGARGSSLGYRSSPDDEPALRPDTDTAGTA